MTLPCVFVLDNDYTMYISWYMNCEYHMSWIPLFISDCATLTKKVP